jgi:hypothetical protein
VKLSDSIKVRLREGQALVYAAEAESRGIGLAGFIRDKLDQSDRVEGELASIRAAMIDMGETLDELRDQLADTGNSARPQIQAEPAIPNAAQIETLMLLREMASTAEIRAVHGELDRQEIKSWRGKVR